LTGTDSIDLQSAKSYVLVGLIFYLLGALIWIFGFLGASLFMGGFMGTGMMGGFPIAVGFPSVFLIISVAFTVWTWITLNNINAGRYKDAQTATLILGIFGIFFAWLVGGIFLLLANGKLDNVIREQTVPKETPQRTGRICVKCGKPVGWDAKFCQHCGKDLA
jgi:uncharacterized membrane protein (DUF485 family)